MALTLEAESWTWFGVVILVTACRFVSRAIHCGGVKRLALEDWLMVFVIAMYTILVVIINIVYFADTNLIDPSQDIDYTPDEIRSRMYGSKLVLVVEQCMISVQWSCKACVLLMYNKLFFGLKQHHAVLFVAAIALLGWIVMEVLYFGVWCRPFNQYWAVPTDNIQCSAATNHLITNSVFNMSTDIMMLLIPLPLLLNSKLEPIKKLSLSALFSLGIFVIVCAVMNKYYSFTQPFSSIWTYWYVREASVAILIANIPNCWPLFRKIFKLRSWSGADTTRTATFTNEYHHNRTANSHYTNDLSNPAKHFSVLSRSGTQGMKDIDELDDIYDDVYSARRPIQTLPPALRRGMSGGIGSIQEETNPFITSVIAETGVRDYATQPSWEIWCKKQKVNDEEMGKKARLAGNRDVQADDKDRTIATAQSSSQSSSSSLDIKEDRAGSRSSPNEA